MDAAATGRAGPSTELRAGPSTGLRTGPSTGLRAGVLLVNLGTPAAPTAAALRPYLREFLSDRRVVDLPRALWWPVLHGFILPLRPARVAKLYAHIWGPDGSPLLAHSRRLADALATRLPQVAVALGMRYGAPSVAQAVAQLRAAGATRLVALPLYPQFSRTTTASAEDALRAAAGTLPLQLIQDYHDDPGYIGALRDSVHRHWQRHGRGQLLLMSFHGLPARYTAAGDPYEAQCRASAMLLARSLGLADAQWRVSFQSRVGRARWSQPYTEEVLDRLPAEGVRRLDVVCPGFAADCLETLEEIALRGASRFHRAGGEALRYIPALNDDAAHADALAARVRALIPE